MGDAVTTKTKEHYHAVMFERYLDTRMALGGTCAIVYLLSPAVSRKEANRASGVKGVSQASGFHKGTMHVLRIELQRRSPPGLDV
jgi:hypothetical protein